MRNKNGRLYYADRRGCQHEERFDPTITEPGDLPIKVLRNDTNTKSERIEAPKEPVKAEKVDTKGGQDVRFEKTSDEWFSW